MQLQLLLIASLALAAAAGPSPAVGVCSDAINKCNARPQCAAKLACFETCRSDPSSVNVTKPISCAVGCNALTLPGAPEFQTYVACMKAAGMTYATAIAITDILDATPQKVYDLLKDAKAYPSWTNNRLVFLPPSLRQGAVFLLLTRIGMLPPAPVPCKVLTSKFDNVTGRGEISFGGSIIPLTGNSIFGYVHTFEWSPINGGVGTRLTNKETWQGAVIAFTDFVWGAAARTYQEFTVQVAQKLNSQFNLVQLTCTGNCKQAEFTTLQ